MIQPRSIKSDNILISWVIPIFNEQDCILEMYSRIRSVSESLTMRSEFICVDDGSKDSSLYLLKHLAENDPRIKLVVLSRNFGHQIAVMAGIAHSNGDCVAVIDADLQDPPEVVGEMVQKWKDGYDVIYGIRRNRKESFLKRKCYEFFYWGLHGLGSSNIPRDAGDFGLMDRRVVANLNALREHRPFIRGLRAWLGFNQVGIEYDRPARHAGKTKYTFTAFVLFQTVLEKKVVGSVFN